MQEKIRKLASCQVQYVKNKNNKMRENGQRKLKNNGTKNLSFHIKRACRMLGRVVEEKNLMKVHNGEISDTRNRRS